MCFLHFFKFFYSSRLLSGGSARVFNDYTVEPQYRSQCKSENVSSSPKTPHQHCPTCGRKYKLNVSFQSGIQTNAISVYKVTYPKKCVTS